MSDGQKAVSMMSVSPDPEVTPKAKRRIFNATYKRRIRRRFLPKRMPQQDLAISVNCYAVKGSIPPP